MAEHIDLSRFSDAMNCRRSVREYLDKPMSGELAEKMADMCRTLSRDGIKLTLIENGGLVKFKKPPSHVIVISGGTKLHRAGYQGEWAVITAASVGIGTCWLGGGKKAAAKRVSLEDGEKVVALIAMGWPETPLEPIIVSDRKRRPVEKLMVIPKGFSVMDILPWQRAAINAARNAPSAMNLQPWRFAFTPNGHLCVTLAGLFGPAAQLDLGIAMLHAELGAYKEGVTGTWSVTEDGAVHVFSSADAL